jgi:hypothetical protein
LIGGGDGNGVGFGFDRRKLLPRSAKLDFAGVVGGSPSCGAGVVSSLYANGEEGIKGLPGKSGRRGFMRDEPSGNGVEYWKAVQVLNVPGYFPGMVTCVRNELRAWRVASWD